MNKKQETKNTPVKKFRSGSVCVTIWRNKSKEGNEFLSFQPEASYRTESGDWEQSHSLSLGQMLRMRECIARAIDFATVQEE